MFYSKGKIVICVVCSICFCSCSTQPRKEAGQIPVKTITVSTQEQAGRRTYVGTVEESYGSLLSFATVGTVSKVLIDEGQAVSQGQVLAVLDKTSAENAFQIAKSTLSQTQDAFNRLHTLYKKGSLPEIKDIEIQTQLAQAQASERIARKNLEDCVLHAPFAGYISKKIVEVGNNVMPGVGCFKLVKIDQVKVKVSIPEKEISGIKKGDNIGFTVAALDNRSFIGKVLEKGVQANPLSHTYDIKIGQNNRDHALLPGMVCRVEIDVNDLGQAILIPQNAVMIDEKGTFVWVVENGQAKRRFVISGGVNDRGVIIIEGLTNSEKIIVSGQDKVSEGSKIKES